MSDQTMCLKEAIDLLRKSGKAAVVVDRLTEVEMVAGPCFRNNGNEEYLQEKLEEYRKQYENVLYVSIRILDPAALLSQ